MEEKDLAYYLTHPEEATSIPESTLRDWIEKYPYSPGVRWLKARKDLFSQSKDMEKSISMAARYSQDLRFLKFNLLRDPKAEKSMAEQAQNAKEEVVEPELKNQAPEPKPKPAVEEKPSTKTKSASAETPATQPSKRLKKIVKKVQKKTTSSTSSKSAAGSTGVVASQQSQTPKQEKPVEKPAIAKVKSESVETPPSKEKKPVRKAVQSKKPTTKKAVAVDSRASKKTSVPKAKPAKVEKKETKSVEKAEKPSAAEKEAKQSAAEREKMVDAVLRKEAMKKMSFSQWLISLEENGNTASKPSAKKAKKKKKKKSKKKKSRLEKLVDESLAERSEAMTETYADLIAAQGYTQKAAEIYRRLQLKFPEKSGYFAAKIGKLEN